MPVGMSAVPPSAPFGAHVQYAPVAPSLGELRGLVVRQKTQKTEAIAQTLGIPYEAANKYRVSALPVGKAVKSHPEDPDGWAPTGEELEQLDAVLFAREESDSFTRTVLTWLGCKRLRQLLMHFSVAGASGDVYILDRPFRLGGAWCCPLEMTVNGSGANGQPGGARLGRVRESFSPYVSRCLTACCLATTYTDIDRALPDGSYETRYSLRTNLMCCGRVNNCCGATCFKNDAVYDVLDTRGEVVAHLQQTYGGDDAGAACCRAEFGFTTYLLEFPRDSTPEDRVLLLAALFQVEFQHFEGGDE